MPLRILTFRSFGPAYSHMTVNLNDAQHENLMLDAAATTLKHEFFMMTATEDGTVVITCPGQGPISIPIIAANAGGMFLQPYYVPRGSTIRWVTTTL